MHNRAMDVLRQKMKSSENHGQYLLLRCASSIETNRPESMYLQDTNYSLQNLAANIRYDPHPRYNTSELKKVCPCALLASARRQCGWADGKLHSGLVGHPLALARPAPSKLRDATVRVCVCVCVRSDRMPCHQSFLRQQGDHPFAVCDGPTKRPQQMRISRLITSTYLCILCDSKSFWPVVSLAVCASC